MVGMALAETLPTLGINLRALLFLGVSAAGIPLYILLTSTDALVQAIWARVALGFTPVAGLALVLLFWNLARASVLVPQSAEPDYWRCPDGKLHVWRHHGGFAQLYLWENCPMTTDKKTLKAKTDQGPDIPIVKN